jgi:lysophospholipase L1-like esterase
MSQRWRSGPASDPPRPPAAFVAGWWAATAAAGLVTLMLAAHQSEEPRVAGRYSVPFFAGLLCAAGVSVALLTARRTGLMSAVHRRRARLAVSVLAGASALLAAELGLRIVDPLGLAHLHETARYQRELEADPALIYRHRRSWQTVYQGVPVAFNELGLRDEPIRPKQEGECRVLLLGDSVVFGWGVEREQAVAHRLEGLLSRALGRAVRVINAGVGSYNTLQEWRFLSGTGFGLDPDAVLLLYVANDVDVHREPFDLSPPPSRRGPSLPRLVTRLLGRSWLVQLSAIVARTGTPEPVDRSGPGWRASMQALRQIRAATAARGIPLVPFFFRWEVGSYGGLFADTAEVLRPVVLHDVGAWFAGRRTRDYTNSVLDVHPNGRGHEVMAREMARILVATVAPDGAAADPGAATRWTGRSGRAVQFCR